MLIDLMKENGFTSNKGKKQKILPPNTITDADYADDQVFLGNTPAPAESLLYHLEQTARAIRISTE